MDNPFPVAQASTCQGTLDVVNTLLALARKGDPVLLSEILKYVQKRDDSKLNHMKCALVRSVELAKDYKIVRYDDTATRVCAIKQTGTTVKYDFIVPLVVRVHLPVSTTSIVVKVTRNGDASGLQYDSSVQVPRPPDAALQALKESHQKFDLTELWWVPKKFDEVKKPTDPIIVGKINITKSVANYFEIYRWIDESVEDLYWAKEGY